MSGPHGLLRLVLPVLLLGVSAAAGRATEVEVRVLNSADAAGSMRVEVCAAAEWLKGCTLSAAAPARAGVSVVVVRDVPPGVYGVIAHHDSDDDTKVNRNLLGLPTEGVGFSREAAIRLGPPRFDDAALRIEGPRAVVPITLQFEHALTR